MTPMPEAPLPAAPTAPDDDRQLPHGERVAAELRDEILRGRFRAGERLPSERDLALRFGVHRGAVREALKKLEQLGLAEIRPGGARVAALEQASLDIVEHLIDLEDPPDPKLVDQVIEVLAGLFALAARLGVERADDAQRERAIEILRRLEDADVGLDERHARLQALGNLFVDASGNLVLHLVRGGVIKATRILDRLHSRHPSRPPLPDATTWLRQIRAAVTARDGAAAAEGVHRLTLEFRRFAWAALESERAAAADAGSAR